MKKYIILLGAILAVFTYNYLITGKAEDLQPQIAQKIIRFHVRANSDSREDQKIKLKVRDEVGAFLEPKLQGAKNKEDCRRIIEENMEQLVELSDKVLKKNKADYVSRARITWTKFPEKTYGDYTFPKGEYEALQIELGSGAGHNWWCVLYPNMCFRGSVYQVIDENSKQALRQVLTQEEYEEVFNGGKTQFKMKVLEYFGISM